MITVEEVRLMLKLAGITCDLSDEEILKLIQLLIHELEALTGLPITEKHYIEDTFHFNNNHYVTTHYPVLMIENITIDDKVITPERYNYSINGIIRFNGLTKAENQLFRITYICKLSDDEISTLIEPLLMDMIKYFIQERDSGDTEFLSSIHEGDVSVTYSKDSHTSNSLKSLIMDRIKDLKNLYNSRTGMI